MKNFKNIFISLVLLVFILSGCRKDGDQVIEGSSSTALNGPVELINATFDGVITDQFGNVIGEQKF